MNAQFWQAVAAVVAAYAALFGGIWAVITRPLESRLTDIIDRLRRIEEKLDKDERKFTEHGERIVRLEERRFR